MKKVEEYDRLKASLEDYEKGLPGLKVSLREAQSRQAVLKDAAFKAETLKVPDWERTAAVAKDNARRIQELQDEIEKAETAMRIIDPELVKVSREAALEIQQSYWPRYEKILRTFISKLKEAEPFERELQKIQAEAMVEIRKFGYRGFAEAFVVFPILTETYGPRGDLNPGALAHLIARAKEDGIEA